MARSFHPGMGQAVAERTILRRKEDGAWETWGDVANRVAVGNTMLHESGAFDREGFKRHLENATILMSGRHLQHGDENQPSRNLEVFSNCSTSAVSFLLFYLLLNGSGVGRAYDDDLMVVNWDNMPTVRCVLDESHADFDFSADESLRDAQHKYGKGQNVIWFEVPDSREGWGQAIELVETLTFQKAYRDHLLVLDFSKVRCKGSPIMGMQGRPSSGPRPMMNALHKIATLKGAGLEPWLQAMYVDHYLAEPVLVGGARRAARMATKWWKDKGIFDFIEIKRPIEFLDLDPRGVAELREGYAANGMFPPMSFLWSSNNSVAVDAEFWELVESDSNSKIARHAKAVFERLTECAYGDGTGEPGIINVDQLVAKGTPPKGEFVGSTRYQVMDESKLLLQTISKRAAKKVFPMITNPCGEISLAVWGGYCVIADNVFYHAESLEEAVDASQHSARALIRVNLMDNLYGPETARTNRIGVGQTGVHEFAWKFFQVGFRHLVNADFPGYNQLASTYTPDVPVMQIVNDLMGHGDPLIRAAAFWEFQGHASRQTMRAAFAYADTLGVTRPHTVTTIKPAGTTSKLFGLTEGWHLPALAHYMRWVQFREDDPLVAEYEAAGYPVRRELKTYRGHAIVGFPTEPTIAGLGMGEDLVLAGDATPEEQYEWLRLGEFFWIEGGSVDELVMGTEPRPGDDRHGNQISYTLKYKPAETSYEAFRDTLLNDQRTVRACSVMPQTDTDNSSYEYLPEQPVTKADYEAAMRKIRANLQEEVDREHIDCASGACPIDFKARTAA